MKIETKYKVGDLVSLSGNDRSWRIIALHISAYSIKGFSILYDLQDDDGKRTMTQEPRIRGRLI